MCVKIKHVSHRVYTQNGAKKNMIQIQTDEPDFSYDIQALTRSFFPGQKIKYFTGDMHPQQEALFFFMCICMEEEAFHVTLCFDGRHLQRDVSVSSQGQGSWHKDEIKSENPFRKRYKNALKREIFQLYRQVVEWSGNQGTIPPWGTLTGVRPVKVALQIKEEKQTMEQVREELLEEYLLSPEKADFALSLCEKESRLAGRLIKENSYSLYVGIPFCPTTCLYCSFTSYPYETFAGCSEKYLDALEREMALTAPILRDRNLQTVYVGGGTPTALTADQLDRMLTALHGYFLVESALEFTVEAGRPDSITPEKLQILKKHGVGRISVNPQTMQDATLVRIGRNHTVEQIREAFYLAREAGFDNINMDLIMGLPGERAADFADTLEKILQLSPDSITTHSLVVKRASALRERAEQGEEFRLHGDGEQMLSMALAFAEEQGYEPYYMYRQKNASGAGGVSGQENIGFARPGKESLYNMLIMEELQTIAALGAGASTKLFDGRRRRISRIENVKSLQDYIDRVEEMAKRKKPLSEDIYFTL